MNPITHHPFCPAAGWIGSGACLYSWRVPVRPAPYLRKVFQYDKPGANARIHICGLGYYELYVNGKRVGDQVLDPVVSQYDRRSRYVTHDVGYLLRNGENVICVILGNGWYNPHSTEVWNFDKVSWRDYPKLLLQLEDDDRVICVSDTTWRVAGGGIVFDGLRNGEKFDARLEPRGWLNADFDDSKWAAAAQVYPPGGILSAQYMPPCKVMQSRKTVASRQTAAGHTIYDAGQNLTGWSRIQIRAAAGAKITLRYSERIDADHNLERHNIGMFIESGDFQTDEYIAAGDGVETFEPRFTYHGFRYVEVAIDGKAEIVDLVIRVVYTAFECIGDFKSSDEDLNKLQECAWWSYVGNFTGIPTDCPHREKNGWTGDALLAAETGLFNFDAGTSYRQWLENFSDVQRPNGQLPGIVPSGGWGFNWGSGPAWDSAYIMIPWYVYLFTGDAGAIIDNYTGMKKYLGFCREMSNGHLLNFGLGDWCHHDQERIAPVEVTSTGYYYCDTVTMKKCAALLGFQDDVRMFTEQAEAIKNAFHRKFYHGNGIYADDSLTAMSCALYHGLTPHEECEVTAARLAARAEELGCIADFGILGAKYTPRTLADYGYIDLAYRMITQPEFPGWVNWLRQGATTLWESWCGSSSRNHIMFGDVSAWMYQYLGGITPMESSPGMKHIRIAPKIPTVLKSVEARHRGFVSRWQRDERTFSLTVEIPAGHSAEIVLPDGSHYRAQTGKTIYECGI